MSILNVDQISPIGSGTTITLNATEVKTGNEITVGTGASIFSPAGNTLVLGTNNLERIRIKNDGKVGIGTDLTTTPSSVLTVAPHTTSGRNISIYTSGAVGNKAGLFFNQFSGTGNLAEIQAEYKGTNSGDLIFNTSMGERLRIDSTGDIGLGESNPNRSGYSSPVVSVGYNSSNGYGVLELLGSQTSDNTIANIVAYNVGGSSRVAAIAFERSGANNSGAIRFETYASGSSGERLRIASDGKVSVGSEQTTHTFGVTGGASQQFQVKGGEADIWMYSTGSNKVWRLLGSTGGSTHQFRIFDGEAGADRLFIGSTGRVNTPAVYGTAISSPMRDLYIENTGQLGYNPSIRASKINIADNTDVSWLYNLAPKTYNKRKRVSPDTNEWTNEAETDLQYGLIAEDVESVNSNICFYDVDDSNKKTLAGVTYSQLITPLLKALQEQKAEIDALKTRIITLEGS